MSNSKSLTHSKLDQRLQRHKDLSLPLQLLFLPVLLPLALFILIFFDLRPTQGESDPDFFKFDREPDLPPETSGQDQDSRSAAAAAQASSQADSPSPRCTCPCHHHGANKLTPSPSASSSSSPRSSQSSGSVDSVPAPNSADTSPLGGSDAAYDTVPEEAVAVPAKNTMQKHTGAAGSPIIAHTGEDLHRRPTHSVSPQTRASSGVAFLALTNEQQPNKNVGPNAASNHCNDEEDSEDTKEIRRRNVRMREEGVRVKVGYLQLTSPTATWKKTQGGDAGVAAAGSSSPSVSGLHTPPTPSSSGSGSGSPASAILLSPAAPPAPAHTPISGNIAVSPAATPPSPQQQQKVLRSSVLPTSGTDAGPALSKIQEKLLAFPADAVSRRLLIDGRAILHRKIRTPRSPASSNGGGCSGQDRASGDGRRSNSGYPSDLME